MVDRNVTRSPGIERAFQDVFPVPVKSTRAPLNTDVKFPIGQVWVRTDTAQVYMLAQLSSGSASWTLAAPGASDVDTLTGDSGGAISPAAGNITLAGGTNVTTAGAGSTVTFNLDGAISLATSVTAPLFTAGAGVDLDLTAPVGQDAVLKLGDTGAANKLSITDSADVEIASVDSDGAAIFSLSASSPLYTTAAGVDLDLTVVSGQNAVLKLGDAAGSNKLSITDSADVEIALIDSDGNMGISGNLALTSVATQIQMNGGAATDFIGQATLVAGTVTIANTNIAATDRILLQRAGVGASTALGILDTSIIASTSFTIVSRDASSPGSTETGDISVVNYFIVREV
jgi:hypothetical protein